MHAILLLLLYTGSVACVLAFLTYAIAGGKFADRLKALREPTWARLGGEGLFRMGADQSQFFAYLIKRQYLSLDDELLRRYGDLMLAMLWIVAISASVTLGDVVAMVFLLDSGG